jgi:hypothetical protein
MHPRRIGVACVVVLASMAALGIFAGSGCVSNSPDPDEENIVRRPKLIRIQTGRDVTLQWPAEPGQYYMVIYTPNVTDPSAWRTLPGYERVPGTQGNRTITFQSPAPGNLYYRVQTVR